MWLPFDFRSLSESALPIRSRDVVIERWVAISKDFVVAVVVVADYDDWLNDFRWFALVIDDCDDFDGLGDAADDVDAERAIAVVTAKAFVRRPPIV